MGLRTNILCIVYLIAGFILVAVGVIFSPRPGTIPFFTIVAVTVAFLLLGRLAGLVLMEYSKVEKAIVLPALKQYYAIVILTAFSFESLCGYFFLEGIPFHDNRTFYSLFHDNLQSLNYFGRPAWWFPHNQFGFPGYFYSILGNMNCLSPIFVILAAFFWVIGRLGIQIINIMPLYIWYFGAIVPFVFSLSVWFFARRILTSPTAIIFVAILSAFSPGVLLNFGDMGLLEATAYGLLLAAAYVRFVDQPSRTSFLVFVLMLLIFAVTINYTLIIWNLLFLVALFLVMMFPQRSRVRSLNAFRYVSKKKWAIVALLVMVCLSPPFLTLVQKGDIVRTTTYAEKENRYLHMEKNAPGNPLEALMAGTPGVGFFGKNTEKGPYVNFPVVVGSGYMGYIYLGLMTIPLLIIGLLYGRPDWRARIFILIATFFCVVILANYSPLFLIILNLNTFLTRNSHFNDVLYRSGGFVLLIIGAGMGLESLLKSTALYKRTIMLFIMSSAMSFILYLFLSRNNPVILGFLLGFGTIMTLSYLIVLSWLRIGQNDAYKNLMVGIFLLLVLCDVSTLAHMHVREVMHPDFPKYRIQINLDVQNNDKIGLLDYSSSGQAETTLSLASRVDLQKKGLAIGKLPKYALFNVGYLSKDIAQDDIENAIRGRSLALDEGPTDQMLIMPSAGDSADKEIKQTGEIVQGEKSYSSRRLNVRTDKAAMLFVRDGYHPYWKAKINGKETKIFRAIQNFKAIIVPKGEWVIDLSFRPPGIAVAATMAYLAILLVFIFLMREIVFVGRTERIKSVSA